MRYKENHKEETHKKIVEMAAREFRTRGFDGIGIGPLMSQLKLTNGGFYAHFEDKENLIAEAMSSALEQSLGYIVQALEQGGITSLINYYTSDIHRDNPGWGCPLPSLTAEEARRPIQSRESFTRDYSRIIETVVPYVSGDTLEQRAEKVHALFTSLIGAVSLARAVSDPVLSDRILRATREHLIECFGVE